MRRLRIGLIAAMVACYSILLCLSAGATCEGGLPLSGSRGDVLIIVNDNSVDSCEVATHYAQARGLGINNIVHVLAPTDYLMDWTQFTILRDQVIKYMQQQIKDNDPTFTPYQCTGSLSPYYCQQSMDQLRSRTPVRYVITTRGVPTRVIVDNSNLFQQYGPTSVDNYLKYWLINYFSSDVSFSSLSINRAQAFGDGTGMRIVNPPTDNELIIGRMDGLNLQAANQLVDRAISAEQKGFFGKLYGNYGQGNMRFYNYNTNNYIYGDYYSSWRLQFGLFHETDPECFDYTQADNYLNYPFNSPDGNGKSPEQCMVRISKGDGPYNDTPPGVSDSRSPLPLNALVYLGNLNGQATGYGVFSNFLNWRHDSTCTSTLCVNSLDPAACSLASVDIFKELDTRCVGVADGFIGYNYQSFPLSYLMAAPSGWSLPMDGGGNGDLNHVGLPIVRTDIGYDDSYSLWYYNPDQIAAPTCYTSSSFAATQSCPEQRYILIEHTITLPTQRSSVGSNPDKYRIRLYYKAGQLSRATMLTAVVKINGQLQSSAPLPMLPQPIPTTGSPNWSPAEAILTLNPSNFPGWDGNYTQFDVWISNDNYATFSGDLGIDAVSVKQVDQNGIEISGELIQNGSFDQGHMQSQVGDFTDFLSRLNGTAFWGSLSHHESGGSSFSSHPVETLTYFLRGLPLGDAVWFSEPHNSGVLYGDPLYSPVAVRLLPVMPILVGQQITLTGSTLNGNDPSQVATQFLVEYCAGSDFFDCQQRNAWQPTGVSGQGGSRNIVLGIWNTKNFSPVTEGPCVLRLSVTSTNNMTGARQTFSDYANTYVYTDWAAAYNDPVLNPDPVSSGSGSGACQNKHILNTRTGTSYDSLDQAVSASISGDVIKLFNKAVVAINNPVYKDVTLDGGYDCQYANKIGLMMSTVIGQTNIQNGAASIGDILLETGMPGTPTNVSAIAGNAQATVYFIPPSSNGSDPTTGFTVTSTPSHITVNGTSSPITVTGLTNGTAYAFTVTASNSAGTGPPSSPSNSVTPCTVPAAPTSISAIAGNAQAAIYYTPPATNGGNPITSYSITSTPGNIEATGVSSPIIVTGLSNRTSYTFTVSAINAAGTGPASTTSNSVTPTSTNLPGVPTNVSATAGPAQATITFAAPISNGGSPITSYIVLSSPGNISATSASSPITVTGLMPGTSYTFTVTAVNANGYGPFSTSSNSVIPTSPQPVAVPGLRTSGFLTTMGILSLFIGFKKRYLVEADVAGHIVKNRR